MLTTIGTETGCDGWLGSCLSIYMPSGIVSCARVPEKAQQGSLCGKASGCITMELIIIIISSSSSKPKSRNQTV